METFKYDNYLVNGKVALENNGYRTCERIYGSQFVQWFSLYFNFTNGNRRK